MDSNGRSRGSDLTPLAGWRSIVVTVLLVGIGGSGCGDPSVNPAPVKYNIYISHEQNEVIYVVDADSLAIVDSIPDVPLAWDIESSPDGRWLYVQTAYDHSGMASAIKFDMKTKKRASSREGSSLGITLLEEGDLMLRGAPRCLDGAPPVQLLKAADLELIAEYSDSLCRYAGSYHDAWVAAATSNNESRRMMATNVLTDSLLGLFHPRTQSGSPLYVSAAQLHPNKKWIWLVGRAPNGSKWAVVGDIETDSCVFDLSLASLVGGLAISDDGRWGVATDPDRPGTFGEPTRMNIIDFGTLQSRIVENLSVTPVQAKFLPKTDIVVLAKEYRNTLLTGPIEIQLIAVGEGKSLGHATLGTNNGRIGGIGVGVRYDN